MKINKFLWFIPVIGIFHIIYMGMKYGFYTNIINLSKSDTIIGMFLHTFIPSIIVLITLRY